MTYIRSPYPNELYHHGIKGQKWGVRRFQNQDGSLTSAGKKRYNKSIYQKIDERVDSLYQRHKNIRTAGLEATSQLATEELRSRIPKSAIAAIGGTALGGGASAAAVALGAIGAMPIGAAIAAAGGAYAVANMVKAFKNVTVLSEAATYYKYLPDNNVKLVNVT